MQIRLLWGLRNLNINSENAGIECGQKSRYKHRMSFVERTSLESITSTLFESLDFAEVDFFQLTDFHQKNIIFNALHSHKNETLHLNENDLDVRIYKLLQNSKSRTYYDDDCSIAFPELKYTGIFLVIEAHTLYSFSNCNRLLLEVLLLCGININDYENETESFKRYFAYLRQYIEQYEKCR
jgi:hypothetical protein